MYHNWVVFIMKISENEVVCTSYFKTGNTTTKSDYTRKWIEIINQIEKNKKPLFSKK